MVEVVEEKVVAKVMVMVVTMTETEKSEEAYKQPDGS